MVFEDGRSDDDKSEKKQDYGLLIFVAAQTLMGIVRNNSFGNTVFVRVMSS